MVTAGAFLLALWGRAAERQVRATPDYQRVDISDYLDRQGREEWTEKEYSLLFQQTGLAPSGVDALRREGRLEELLVLQEKLFAQTPFTCRANTILTREEIVAEEDRVMDGKGLTDSAEISAGGVTGHITESYASIPYVHNCPNAVNSYSVSHKSFALLLIIQEATDFHNLILALIIYHNIIDYKVFYIDTIIRVFSFT